MGKHKKRKLGSSPKVLFSVFIIALLLTGFQSLKNTKKSNETLSNQILETKEEIKVLKSKVDELRNDLVYEPNESPICGLSSVECNPWRDQRFEALVIATWRLETGNGTSLLWLNSNNPGGIKCGLEYCSYQTQEEGMRALETLLEWYVDEYAYNLEEIRYKYCGQHCGSEDLKTFTEIFNQEKERMSHD